MCFVSRRKLIQPDQPTKLKDIMVIALMWWWKLLSRRVAWIHHWHSSHFSACPEWLYCRDKVDCWESCRVVCFHGGSGRQENSKPASFSLAQHTGGLGCAFSLKSTSANNSVEAAPIIIREGLLQQGREPFAVIRYVLKGKNALLDNINAQSIIRLFCLSSSTLCST